MNKKVALSLLSATVFASMTASAFAAPKSGVYMGGDVDRYYALTDLFKLNDAGYAKFQSDLAKTKFENLIFVDHDGKGASLKEILSSTQDFEKIKRDLKQTDFEGEYAKSNLDGTNGESYDPRKDITPEPTGELKVESVSAINAKVVKVTFGKQVDKASAINEANYQFIVNGSPAAVEGDTEGDTEGNTEGKKGTVTEDGKSVLFILSTPLKNADKYSVNVNDAVLDKDLNKFEKYADTVKTFSDTAAPQLLSAKVTAGSDANKKKIELAFNEPVSSTMTVKVDGVQVATSVTTEIDGEDYLASFEVPVAGHEDLFKVGTHEVVVYNAKDLLPLNPNKASVLKTSYTVTADTNAPSISEVKSVNSRAFHVTVSEKLKSAPVVTLKKGNYTIPDSQVQIALDTKADPTGKTYRISVMEDAAGSVNPLYAEGESSVTLQVTLKDYKDLSDLVGAQYNGSVTLTKDTATPKAVSANANTITGSGATTALEVKIDGKVELVDGSKITVKNKDGVVLERTSASITGADGNIVKVVIGKATPAYATTEEPYTVEFDKGAIKYVKVDTAKEYSVNTNANEVFATTVKSSNTVAPVTVKNASIIQTQKVGIDGELVIDYGVDMGDSAKDVANYKLDGGSLPAGTTATFVGGVQKVKIVLPAGTFEKTQYAKFTITTAVKTKTGSQIVADEMEKTPVEGILKFTDNKKPVLVDAKYYVASKDEATTDKIKLTFSEAMGAISDTADFKNDFKVVINGNEAEVKNIANAPADKKSAFLTVATKYNVNQAATISVVAKGTKNPEVNVTDAAGNKLTEGTSIVTTGFEVDPTGAADAQAVAQVEAKIDAIPATVTLADKNTVNAAKTAYDALSATQKAAVNADKKAKLDAAVAKIAELEAIPAARAALDASITSAEAKANAAVAGTKVGNYPQEEIDDLKAAIATAKGVYDNAAATVQELKDAQTELDNDVKAFDDKVVEAVVTTVKATANPTEVTKPATGQTATVQITAKVKDQDGNEMTAELVTYEVNATGVSIDANGLLTVNDNASTGDVTVTVKSKTKNTVTTTVTVTIK